MKSVFTDKYNEFLNIMITARKEAGITQLQLAECLNKPQSYVSKYERKERRLDVIEFLTIANALKLDPCDVINQINCLIYSNSHKDSD